MHLREERVGGVVVLASQMGRYAPDPASRIQREALAELRPAPAGVRPASLGHGDLGKPGCGKGIFRPFPDDFPEQALGDRAIAVMELSVAAPQPTRFFAWKMLAHMG